MTTMTQDSDFWKLARSIETIDQLFKQETAKAVNRNLTARNWLIGFYLFHYEQQGNDRAEYGTRLLQNLAKNLNSRSLSYGNLKLYRQFYQEFRQLEIPIRHYISTNNDIVNYLSSQIGQTLLGHLGEEVKDTSRLHIYLLELGQGFCFEARQKRILIDDEYFYCDLVFYHRVLKCHIIVELKSHKFRYSDLAQLNMYVAYFKKNMMLADDNPPVGILLCTEVGKEQVEYATAGMDQQLFVSKYLLQLPPKEKLTDWINTEVRHYDSK